ncbi:hypothetical protein [Paraburkholderia sp. 35.1]|uniref:hypothetical protein n=1 Tax=Paraburkholderia sp. 35.1 TaxID=2991058 RepID=UPI003D21085E
MKHHWRRLIAWTKEIADPELAELSRRTRHQISSQFLVDALMNTVAKRRAGEIEFGHIKMVVGLCPDAEKNPQVYADHQPRHMSNAATVFGGMGKPDRADTTRQASGRSRRRLLPAKLRIVLQTFSISAAYLRTVEANLDFALASRRILKSNRFLSKSFASVRSTLKGRTAHRRQS